MGRLFGTDGVRGIANTALTCELAMEIGRAAAMVLADGTRRRPLILIGKDTRLSSDMLEGALTAGLCSVGADVILTGVVPTPAVAYLVGRYKADAGIMISASHNPYGFNGIKIFSGDGFKLPDALEEQVEAIVLDHVKKPVLASGGEIGKVSRADTAVKDYVDHLKSTVLYSLEGLRVAIDAANGSASVTAARLFSQLGAEAVLLSDRPNGVNINDGCGSTHMGQLQKMVAQGGFDAGIAFDGDADRCLCVDENGSIMDGDQIMAVCALDMQERGKLAKNTVVGTVMTNLGFIRFCEEQGMRFIATKVGDRFVLEELLLEEYSFGGEQSGHVIFRDFASTGDGQLTAIQLLSLMRRKGQKLSELSGVMKRFPQTMINVPVSSEGKLACYTNSAVKQAVEDAKSQLGSQGRILVRVSGTEPYVRVMTEGEDPQAIEEIAAQVASVVEQELKD